MHNKKSQPVIVIGMFLYNEERHVGEAIESLLSQTYKDFQFIILNDCSTDRTKDIVKNYAKTDKRIHYFENKKRKGYAENYRRCFQLADELLDGKVDYLAWAAGHDAYHKKWLEEMVNVLNRYKEVVMAYPLTVRISDTGEKLPDKSPQFDTFGLAVENRIKAMYGGGIGYGSMIYGLFRADVLRNAGIFPKLLVPDMALLVMLILYGSFFQVKKKLWYRRYVNLFSIQRQKRSVFSHPPFYSNVPWPIVTMMYLFWKTYVCPNEKSLRKYGLTLCLLFLHRYYPLVRYHYPKYGKYLMIPYFFFFKYILRLERISQQ